jgi:ribose transport system ATP-binding protein
MKIIGGVLQPDAGSISVDGIPVMIKSTADAIRLAIGFIHQELNVLDNLDIAGNVFLGREPVRGGFLRLLDREKMLAETTVYLRRLGLELPSDTPLANLSIAQRQLVEIAKSLSLNTRILIMDEPTSSLTQSETTRLLALVKGLRAQGTGVIYISHRLGEIEEIADRAVVLRDGANAGTLSRAEITHDRLVTMMVGRDLKHFYSHPGTTRRPRAFEIDNLRTSRYPERKVSFEIGAGEILGMAGLVGAGRTELAEAIFGLDSAYTPALKLNGESLRVRSPQDAIQYGIYLVPEDRRQCGLITASPVRENISLPALDHYAQAGLISFEREQSAAKEICRKLNIKTPNVETRVSNLSGGNQQKVVLAKWLLLEPKVLIFDEPTRGIDVGAKAEIYELMRNLADAGAAILMISSDMEEILGVSDRVAVMHEGALTGVLERADCTEANIMRLAVGREGLGRRD